MRVMASKINDTILVNIDNQIVYTKAEAKPDAPPELIKAVGDDLAFAVLDKAMHRRVTLFLEDRP